MSGEHLVGYDIAGIHRYVFEPVRPVDVMGGSAILEAFADDAATLGSGRGARCVYSAGGAGLFIAADEASARALAEELEAEVDRRTGGGVRCVAATVPAEGSLAEARGRLVSALRARRLQLLLEGLPRTLVPAGTHPRDVCQGCGREPATQDRTVGERQERIGERCALRYAAGRSRRAPSIPELFGVSGEDLPRGAVLAALYLEAEGLGARMAGESDPEALATLSGRVREGVTTALRRATSGVSQPAMQVVAGGDDVLLFCDAALLLDLAEKLWAGVQPLRGELAVRFSAGVVVGEPYLPLRLFFREAEGALREAKARSYRTAEPHVATRALMAGHRGVGSEDLLGGPLPLEAFRSAVPQILAHLEAVPSSQRAGLLDDLSLPSREEAALAVDYRAAQARERGDTSLRELLDAVADVARRCGADDHALLRGALVLARARGREGS